MSIYRLTLTLSAVVAALLLGPAPGVVAAPETTSCGVGEADYLDVEPPLCSGDPYHGEGGIGIDGTAWDDRDFDTGICYIYLDEGSTNLSLTVDYLFNPGDGYAEFWVVPTDPGEPADGTVWVEDGAGNKCRLGVDFRNLPAGPTESQPLCNEDGIAFSISNDDNTPAGPAACSSEPVTEGTPLPPGYKPSPGGDPTPCRILTIDSPITGTTHMIYKKDGVFDDRLRLLFSKFDGVNWPDFVDITESVEPLLYIVPDPTKLGGRGGWSQVKVCCAILAEICDGIDNDGDGEIDEDLPVGDPSVDNDGDGYPLCPDAPGEPDCNDQLDFINPGASETCNGMDDDCDGVIDEGDPGGGAACTVDGQLGACADGLSECFDGALICNQTVFPEMEICDNGIDDDCDELTDDEDTFDCQPLLVYLESFTAEVVDGAVHLEWITTAEIDNAGFVIYRQEERSRGRKGKKGRGSGGLVPISGLIPAQGSDVQGAAYELLDSRVKPKRRYTYVLEDIDLSGNRPETALSSVTIEIPRDKGKGKGKGRP